MAEQWHRVTLGEFVTLQRGHDLPDQVRRPGRVPILGSFGVTGYHDEARAPGPGVTVGRSGASFGVATYSNVDYWPLNTALYVTDFHGNDPKFAYYFLKAFDFARYNSGSAQPSPNRNFIHPVPILVPPVGEQRTISGLLTSLDDKIELNRQMNETLEAMARALFKSWFVDFDPVRAKMAGRAPFGMDAATAALFPETLVAGIPTGWQWTTLAQVATAGGGDIQTGPFGSQQHVSDYVVSGIPVVMPTNIRDRRVSPADIAHIAIADVERLSRHVLHDGDIVYSRRGDVEKHALIGPEEDGWLCGTGCLRVHLGTADKRVSPYYVSLALDDPRAREWISARAVGATMPNLNTGILASLPMLLPSRGAIEAFATHAAALDRRTRLARAESRTLAELRDLLLPKLLSGELRIRDAEKAVEAVI